MREEISASSAEASAVQMRAHGVRATAYHELTVALSQRCIQFLTFLCDRIVRTECIRRNGAHRCEWFQGVRAACSCVQRTDHSSPCVTIGHCANRFRRMQSQGKRSEIDRASDASMWRNRSRCGGGASDHLPYSMLAADTPHSHARVAHSQLSHSQLTASLPIHSP